MGACCDRDAPSDVYAPSGGHNHTHSHSHSHSHAHSHSHIVVDPVVIDKLVLELLSVIANFSEHDEESPVAKLHIISDTEDGWFQVVSSLIHVIPLDNPLGPSVITIVFDDGPLPAKDSVIKLTRLLGLSAMRALTGDLNIRIERNICVVLGCIADKLAGPNSAKVLTEETLDYMLSFIMFRREPRIVLFALIALEKFANTTENKVTIQQRLLKEEENPLETLAKHADSEDFIWRQVGFCAKWSLDNHFVIEGRPLGYEVEDMSGKNAILNSQDVSEYLKISSDGLEARCDSYSFESVRSTFMVNTDCWYYECTIITPGVMQIGWATKHSHFLNHEGYGIGDDLYSLSYDGCRKLIWHEAKPVPITEVEVWKPGDVVGCLIDMDIREAVFYLNGNRIRACTELFESTRSGNKNTRSVTYWLDASSQGFFAAASFMAFQQCRFNFGHEPFKFPPADRAFKCFNDYGSLTPEEKQVIPRRLILEKLRTAPLKENACTLCCDEEACCVLEPCNHRGFCSVCTSQLKECPMCRSVILNVRLEAT